MGSSREEAAAGGRIGDPETVLFETLRRLIDELDAQDLAEVRSIGRPMDAAAPSSSRPAVIGLTATLRRFAALAESDDQPLRLKGLRGLAHAERLVARRAALLDQATTDATPANVPGLDDDEQAIHTIYRWSVGRVPGPSEVSAWTTSLAEKANYPHFVNGMAEGEEARAGLLDPKRALTNGAFVQALFAVLAGRSPNAAEIEHFYDANSVRADSRERVALSMLRERLRAELEPDGKAAPETELRMARSWRAKNGTDAARRFRRHGANAPSRRRRDCLPLRHLAARLPAGSSA